MGQWSLIKAQEIWVHKKGKVGAWVYIDFGHGKEGAYGPILSMPQKVSNSNWTKDTPPPLYEMKYYWEEWEWEWEWWEHMKFFKCYWTSLGDVLINW